MRATGFSRLLCSLLLLSQACSHTTSIGRERGELLSRSQVAEELKPPSLAVEVDEKGSARLLQTQERCVDIAHDYEVLEVETVSDSSGTLTTLAGVGLLALGGVLFYGALSDESDEGAPLWQYLGGGVSIGFGLPLLLSENENGEERRVRTLEETEREFGTDCHRETSTVRGRGEWILDFAGQRFQGSFVGAESLLLPALIGELFAREALGEAALKDLVSRKSIAYRLQLAEISSGERSLSTRLLPDELFERAARRYDESIDEAWRGRWGNCRLIARNAREAFECLWSQ